MRVLPGSHLDSSADVVHHGRLALAHSFHGSHRDSLVALEQAPQHCCRVRVRPKVRIQQRHQHLRPQTGVTLHAPGSA